VSLLDQHCRRAGADKSRRAGDQVMSHCDSFVDKSKVKSRATFDF
jgi:hypothetical protein